MFESISVLMSVYYRENPLYLERALASVYNNSIIPQEVILVEDGVLTDDLYNVIEKYVRDYNLKVVKLAKNVGLGVALNEGLNACSNDLIARMDTDDACRNDRFEKQLAYMEMNPDTVLLGTGIEEYDETMSYSLGQRLVPCSKDAIRNHSIKRNPFNHMTVMFRKNVIMSLGGYQHHLYMEDYNLWLRVIASGGLVANLPDILVNVRAGNNMMKRRRGYDYIKSEFKLMCLKLKLKMDSVAHAMFIFTVRTVTRLLPASVLLKVYGYLRCKVSSK
ncbi:glycosyltransferase [Dryocola sp. BD626]|uniref:glycosyltransferase n=1 Tax=Dryocola sp. BD626 TaxID=3133273 RepID=UPI003F50D1C7